MELVNKKHMLSVNKFSDKLKIDKLKRVVCTVLT